MKISKFDATRCQILRLKCTKFDFRWLSDQTPLGELTALPPDSLAVYNGGLRLRAAREKGEGAVASPGF